MIKDYFIFSNRINKKAVAQINIDCFLNYDISELKKVINNLYDNIKLNNDKIENYLQRSTFNQTTIDDISTNICYNQIIIDIHTINRLNALKSSKMLKAVKI